MSITGEEFAQIFPGCSDPHTWAAAVSASWEKYGFNTRNQRAAYLGICANETGAFTQTKRERLNYTPERAKQIFPKARNFPEECADRCRRGEEAFASWIYAGVLGNGNEASGDGWRFRGNGIPQLTGRANHRAAAQALGIDIENNPELLSEDPMANAACAAWFIAQYTKTLAALDTSDEEAYLAAAAKHGWVDDAGRQRRLMYRRKALEVVRPAGTVRQPSGNVVIRDIKDSTIIKSSNRGVTAGTVAAGAGAAAPVVTKWLDADLAVAIVFGVVVLIAGAGVLYYLLKVKRARRQLYDDGVA